MSAKTLVKAASPARNTPEVGNIGLGSKVQAVEMLTIAPPFCATMIGVTSRVGRIDVHQIDVESGVPLLVGDLEERRPSARGRRC